MKRTAIKAAKEAGKIILSYYSKNVNAIGKGSTYNLVTKADIASENKIISIIKSKFPGHSILTEIIFIINSLCFVYQLLCTKKVNP